MADLEVNAAVKALLEKRKNPAVDVDPEVLALLGKRDNPVLDVSPEVKALLKAREVPVPEVTPLDLFHKRRRDKLRFRRMGFFGPDLIVPETGTGIASPVTDAQGLAPATLVMEFEGVSVSASGNLFLGLPGNDCRLSTIFTTFFNYTYKA